MIITRYIGILEPEMPVISTDFLIIGTGIAGLFTALKAAKYGQVMVLTKKAIKDCNTGLAQGGIAAAVNEEDSPFLHLEDTLEAGAGLCNIEAVDVLVREGPDRVRELIEAGAHFDTKDGNIMLGREAAHSKARILHAADATGEAIRIALANKCEETANIEMAEGQFVVDLLTDAEQNQCLGILVYDSHRQKSVIYTARAIIIATGGAGRLYRFTTNPDVTTGDGMAAAYRAGCELSDMEFIQFHPTVFYSRDHQRFLISEAVRGEGGLLYNLQGERFMPRYHPLKELAPRDIVSRAIWSEMTRTGDKYVYLDMTGIKGAEDRFPTIYKTCLEKGIDIRHEYVPVSPAVHYTMGGIKTNTFGETGINGLYACGEAACTGVHGANRLASNSMLEGIVFGDRIIKKAEEIMYRRPATRDEILANYNRNWVYESPRPHLTPAEAKDTLQGIMWDKVGIIRNEAELKEAHEALRGLITGIARGEDLPAYYEVLNMLTVAHIIVESALWRKESRGAHFRSDYPERDDLRWKKHLTFTNC